MTRTLIAGPDAARYAELLGAEDIPGVDLQVAVEPEDALERCVSAEVLFGPPDALLPLLPYCEKLNWVQSSWAGVKPLVEQPRRDFLLTGVKDIFGPAMTEYVLAWLLALERGVLERAAAQAWDGRPERGLAGRRIGIMGTGSIGSAVARGCRALGLAVSGFSASGRALDDFDQCFAASQLEAFSSGLDYLVMLLPDTADSADLVDAWVLDRLAPAQH